LTLGENAVFVYPGERPQGHMIWKSTEEGDLQFFASDFSCLFALNVALQIFKKGSRKRERGIID